MLRKTTLREIKNSLGRYIAILAIVALGVGFFSGLKVTRQAMVSTADEYLQKHEFYDYQLISTLGFEDQDVKVASEAKGVKRAVGSISMDALIFNKDGDKADRVMKFHSLTEGINQVQLSEGRMPEKADECLADNRMYSESNIGDIIKISNANESDTLDQFKYKEYKIVGIIESPLYMNFERGSTALGNGSISGFLYIQASGFDTEYYTELYVRLNNQDTIYSGAYKDAVDKAESSVKKVCETSAERRYHSVIADAEKKLNKEKKKYNENYQKYISEKKSAEAELASAYSQILSGESKLEKQSASLKTQKDQLIQSRKKIAAGQAQAAGQRAEFEKNKPYMTPDQVAATEASLAAAEKELSDSMKAVTDGLAKISSGESQLSAAKEKLIKNKAEYYSAQASANNEFAAAETKLNDGRRQLDKAETKINKIKKADTYVLTRDANVGYASFENDSNIVDGIAKIFPIFFFLVAALVCMTTMTRMVDEQRTQIGVFKALGYSNSAIMGKYLFYSGSASTIGAVGGFLGGCYLFPLVIWHAYGIMYDFSGTIHYIFDLPLAIISLAVSIICSMGATWISCTGDFRIVPAELIRPKSPKNGKRILLERVTFLWKKISFLYKVTLRNIFRYKKRFLMMILGISGCTALLLTGLGINDSVKNIVDFQYDEITTYDYSVIFNEEQDPAKQKDFRSESSEFARDVLFVHEGAVDFVSGKTAKSIKMIVSDGEDFRNFIDLHTKKAPIAYPQKDEAVICEKLANEFDIHAGDRITLRDSERKTMKVTVSAICQNYIYNYVYVNPETCQSQWGYIPSYKTAYVNAADDSKDGIYDASAKTQAMESVVGSSINDEMRTRVNKMMESLNAVIFLVVLSAGALAFIVLYNLTNINITERIREIATIKVLGFYPKETSAYVFRENFFLTGISALVGLFLGKWLHAFVISQIKIDMISFDVRIAPISYVFSVLLTFAFAIVVSIVMYFKLQRVSMTESLKSIE